MAVNRGKQFEQKVKEDLSKLPDVSIERFADQMSGYRGSRNPCDMTLYWFPFYHYIECKTTNENTFPLSGLTQYDDLLERMGRKGVRSGVVLWFVKWDTVVYIPVATFKQLKDEGKKSVNIKMVDSGEYRIIKIPGVKKRVFIDSDYTVLKDLKEGD